MRADTKKKHVMGRRFAIVMKRRIHIAGATLAVAAGLIGAVAAMAGTPIARPGVFCYGLTPTIVGTSGNDALHGTPGSDVIAGRDGSDRVYGNRGNDVLCGGAGKDTLRGGKGNDELDGQAGNDALNGGRGPKDFCVGGRGNDSPPFLDSASATVPQEEGQTVSGCDQLSIH
jgi:RTX calcium-binding nonapeptide repeat (4 copies)